MHSAGRRKHPAEGPRRVGSERARGASAWTRSTATPEVRLPGGPVVPAGVGHRRGGGLGPHVCSASGGWGGVVPTIGRIGLRRGGGARAKSSSGTSAMEERASRGRGRRGIVVEQGIARCGSRRRSRARRPARTGNRDAEGRTRVDSRTSATSGGRARRPRGRALAGDATGIASRDALAGALHDDERVDPRARGCDFQNRRGRQHRRVDCYSPAPQSAARMSGVAVVGPADAASDDGDGRIRHAFEEDVGCGWQPRENPVVGQLTERLRSNGKTVYRVNPYGKPPPSTSRSRTSRPLLRGLRGPRGEPHDGNRHRGRV